MNAQILIDGLDPLAAKNIRRKLTKQIVGLLIIFLNSTLGTLIFFF
jgi:hypothetical protein